MTFKPVDFFYKYSPDDDGDDDKHQQLLQTVILRIIRDAKEPLQDLANKLEGLCVVIFDSKTKFLLYQRFFNRN